FTLVDNPTRFYYKAIGEAIGVTSMEAMKRLLGCSWAYYLRPAINELKARFSDNPSNWPAHQIRWQLDALLPGVLYSYYPNPMQLQNDGFQPSRSPLSPACPSTAP